MNKKTMKLIMGLLPFFLVCSFVCVMNINGVITYETIHHGYYDEPKYINYWGGTGDEKYVYSAADSNSLLTVVCRSNSTSSSNDLFIIKFDQEMNYRWNESWTYDDLTIPIGIMHDNKNNIYVAGQVITELPGPEFISDIFVLKCDPNGSLLWDTIYLDIDNDEIPSGFTMDSDGNIFIAGSTNSSNGGIFIHKFTNNGVHSDTFYYGNTAVNESLVVGKMFIDFSGDLYISATTNNSQPTYYNDQVLVKMNSTTGIAYWNTTFGGTSDFDKGFDVVVSGDQAFITGYYFNTTSGNYDASIVSINATSGSIIWSNIVSFNQDYSIGITVNNLGNPIITGLTDDLDLSMDIFILEFNQTGSLLWSTIYQTSEIEEVYDIQVKNKLLYICGSQYNDTSSSYDVFILTYEDYTETILPTMGPYGKIFGIIIGIIGLGFSGTLIGLLLITFWKK